MKISKFTVVFCAFVFLLAIPHRALGQGFSFVYGPAQAEVNQDGNSSFAPFATTMSGRFQQVYSASIFSALPPAGGMIHAISLRIDANSSFTINQIEGFQINLSTTTRSPDSLSPVFADNIGPDEQIVRGPASYRIQGGPGAGFSIGFDFDTPFAYNPASGDLLLDFRFSTGAGNFPAGGVFDAFNVGGDSVSSVSAFGPSLPTTGSASSLGLATRFIATSVPEPSSWALLIVGVVCFGLWRKKKSHERRNGVPH